MIAKINPASRSLLPASLPGVGKNEIPFFLPAQTARHGSCRGPEPLDAVGACDVWPVREGLLQCGRPARELGQVPLTESG